MDIFSVLEVDGSFLRRVVVVDGRPAERAAHPGAEEIDVLSKLSELARLAKGLPVYPRHTIGLVEAALATNDPGAWSAAGSDMDTGDYDTGAAASVMTRGANPALLVSCLAAARTQQHAVDILRVFASVSSVVPSDTHEQFGRAIGSQLKSIIDVFVRLGGLMKRDVREALLAEFGKMMTAASVPNAVLADALHEAVTQRKYDLLRMFLPTPIGSYIRVDTLRKAAESVVKVTPVQKHTMLGVVAKAVRENPSLVDAPGILEALQDMLSTFVRPVGDTDVRGCLATSIVAQVVAKDDVSRGLARLLEHVCGRVIGLMN